MSKTILLNHSNWHFTKENPGIPAAVMGEAIALPHTWNAVDGQDGGNDYYRGTCWYTLALTKPAIPAGGKAVLQLDGAAMTAAVYLNGEKLAQHKGGYSTFRVDLTDHLKEENLLAISVDNRDNDTVYPQKADFTFYGGIYRDVTLHIVPAEHFALPANGAPALKVTPIVTDLAAKNAEVTVEASVVGAQSVAFALEGQNIAAPVEDGIAKAVFTLDHAHLWDGVDDPFLYTVSAKLGNGEEASARFGCRKFEFDPQKGFFLNGRSYPLRGVSRHQDRKGLGNAITREMHDEDMALIKEIGANTIRLAHYQHDQYFYDLCDEVGMVVWAEIPYISEHMPNGRENTISQMKELIIQNYNHPCIVCWGVSNEITISTKDKKDMLDNHRQLNDLCHEMDKTRLTTLACYAMCGPFNRSAHITDMVSWNLYLGWYVPGFILNDLWMGFFHLCFPNRPFGYSEYGAEGMPNLHSTHPHRGDHTEEYQAKYHEYMLRCFKRHPWMWATHVWNMFDFAADARDQGGEPGMNHKGLVTFDRKTKKDSFYLYKAWWSDEAFVHICSKRFVERTGSTATVKVYSNQSTVALYVNGNKVGEQTGEHVFTFKVPLNGELHIQAVAGDRTDESVIRHVDTPNPEYKLHKTKSKSANWV